MEKNQLEALIQKLCRAVEESQRLSGFEIEPCRLYPPVDPAEIDTFEEQMGWQFPPSYRLFLSLHNGWEGYYAGFTLIGVSGPHTEKALQDIRRRIEAEQRRAPAGDGVPLSGKIVFGTDFDGRLLCFDGSDAAADGELPVIWRKANGAAAQRHASLIAMFEGHLAFELASIAEKQASRVEEVNLEEVDLEAVLQELKDQRSAALSQKAMQPLARISPDEFEALVQEVFDTLQEYARRVHGQDYEGVLYKGATEEEIASFEAEEGIRFPPSYRAFLRLHNGWTGYARGYTLIGVKGRHTKRALQDLRETVEVELEAWIDVHGLPTPEKVAQFEASGNELNPLEAAGAPFIADKLHFGTDFDGGLLFFDSSRMEETGEMEVVSWRAPQGTLARYPGFIEMLREDLAVLRRDLALAH